ncbi:MAG: EamA family transporter [Odoribacter sp.]
MKGVLLALSTVFVWAILNVANRYCVLEFDINIILFTSLMIFATGTSLMLIREQVEPKKWKSRVKYSWLYTLLQIIRSFTMISTFLYITSTETSILFNIEIIITYILAFAIFKRIPYKLDYIGILLILTGFILFIFSLPTHIRLLVSILVTVSATASCLRSVIIEKTTLLDPSATVRQKCGISGYTMFYGGLILLGFLFLVALFKYIMADHLPTFLFILTYLPDLKTMFHPGTIITACIAGFFLNATTTYLYYATLKYSKSETFMAIRAFQPVMTYGLELLAAIFYAAMRPELSTKDYILGGVIVLGSFLILIIPQKGGYTHQSKTFITD